METPTTVTPSIYSTISESTKYRTILLKGPSGAGKTFKAAQFPKPLFFNFDNNLSGLNKLPPDLRKEVKIVHPQIEFDKTKKAFTGKVLRGSNLELRVWQNFVDIAEYVLEDPEVHTVVIDSLTTLAEYLMDKIVGSPNPATRVEIQHWGDFSRYMKWLGEELLCAPSLDKHVVFCAHEDFIVDNKTKNAAQVLSIGGKMKTGFDLYFTDVWRVFIKPFSNPPVHMVRTVGGVDVAAFSAKTSFNIPPEFEWDKQKTEILGTLAVF